MVESVEPVQGKRDERHNVAHRVNQDAVQPERHEHFEGNPRKTLFILDGFVELADNAVDDFGAKDREPHVDKV